MQTPNVRIKPYHLHVPIVLKSGTLNLLEPSWPVQACTGIALPLPYNNRVAIDHDLVPDPSVLLTVVTDWPQVSEFSPVVPARFATRSARPLPRLLRATWLSVVGTNPSSDPVN